VTLLVSVWFSVDQGLWGYDLIILLYFYM